MNKCIAGRDVDVSNNTDYIAFLLTIPSTLVVASSPTGLDFHRVAFASAMTFPSTIVLPREVLEDPIMFLMMPLTMTI
jgi:hypothetical protein